MRPPNPRKLSLRAALQEQEQAALELNKIAIPYNALVREVETDRALYESVLTRMKVTNVAKGIWANNFRVIETPFVAARPAKPRKLIILAACAHWAAASLGAAW